MNRTQWLKKFNGDEQALKEHFKEMGRKGGIVKVSKGLGTLGKEERRIIQSKGGQEFARKYTGKKRSEIVK